MLSLNGDHITGTTFLYKIFTSVNLQKIHQNYIKCTVCNKNNKLVFNPYVENTFIVLGTNILLTRQISSPPHSSDIESSSLVRYRVLLTHQISSPPHSSDIESSSLVRYQVLLTRQISSPPHSSDIKSSLVRY